MPPISTPFRLTRAQLLADLEAAYLDARRHKRWRGYQMEFEYDLTENLRTLCDELFERCYRPQPSMCFVISDPKRREVFAAHFRDRIVHHLYYNYTHRMFERTFIHDCYSCIRGRGTHFGIHRLDRHIRRESQNYTRPCYVLKLDIRGYFMHIHRPTLLRLALDSLERMSTHRVEAHAPQTWGACVDIDFVCYLTRVLVLLNPVEDCRRIGPRSEWDALPADKSLFCSAPDCGLPIGNLTSQLFSNVYLTPFDQYMKRRLGCRGYGRYVDDAYVVGTDRARLHRLVAEAARFLRSELGLTLHEGKLRICPVQQGVEYLGAFLKPGRRYVSRTTLQRMARRLPALAVDPSPVHFASVVNSHLGILCHYRARRLERTLFYSLNIAWRYGTFVRKERGVKFSPNC